MALSGIQRTFADILDSIWGKDAQTSIPTQPVSGIAYRDTDAEFESGRNTTPLVRVPVGIRCSLCSRASCLN